MNVKSFLVSIVCLVSLSAFSQQLNRMLLENWTNGAWENRMQQRSFYDDEGRLTKNENAHWNAELTIWEDQTKTLFNRDENGNLLSRETLKWMPDQATWQASMRANYTINELKKPSSVLNETFDGNAWSNQTIEDLKYNNNGKLIEKQTERWDKQLAAWVPNKKFLYSIESDRTAGYTIYFWDNNLGDWQPYKKAEYVYAGKLLDHILFDSWEEGTWVAHSIRKNSHNEDGALNTMEVDQFDAATDTWSKSNHVDITLTEFGKIGQSVHKEWNGESSDWANLQRSTYTYSEDGVMVEDWTEDHKPVELFPNPATESLTIRPLPVGNITIFDALGKIVHQTENTQQELKLDVTKWEIGTYTVKVNGNEIEKFVKQ